MYHALSISKCVYEMLCVLLSQHDRCAAGGSVVQTSLTIPSSTCCTARVIRIFSASFCADGVHSIPRDVERGSQVILAAGEFDHHVQSM
jgi:hypothetical protein